ncbi:WW domain-binding protein 11-like isoform X2 [Gallus gallus]|uniref:WW domain-binding protein 11-like isoform X2 n=1 Tax=Gallus gallus TaxID=9031 RepID=UPI001F030830|nr:WW domain-binding protein 11-like isoform X2 [Gallus gallus]
MPASMDGGLGGDLETSSPTRPSSRPSSPAPGPSTPSRGQQVMWATAPPKPVPPPTRLEGPNRLRQGAAGQVPATLWSPPSPGTGSTWLAAPSSGDDPLTKTTVTPGPSDYRTEAANRHVFKCPPGAVHGLPAGAPPDRPPSRSWHLHAAQADGAQHSLHIGQPLLLCEGKEPARSV